MMVANSRIVDFLLTGGIEASISISIDDLRELERIFQNKRRCVFNAYCPNCRTETDFCFDDFETYWVDAETRGKRALIQVGTGRGITGFSNEVSDEEKYRSLIRKYNLHSLTAHCSRGYDHKICIVVKLDEAKITKIGQYPSVILNQYRSVRKYESLLGDFAIELKTAIRLHSHNVGVGSYVYLRRIFEKIIYEKFSDNRSSVKMEEQVFRGLRMDEKIEALKCFLPPFLAENKSIYRILSEGIHELSEDECNEYFEPIKLGIEIILDEIISQKEKEAKKKAITTSISKINGREKKQGGCP